MDTYSSFNVVMLGKTLKTLNNHSCISQVGGFSTMADFQKYLFNVLKINQLNLSALMNSCKKNFDRQYAI